MEFLHRVTGSEIECEYSEFMNITLKSEIEEDIPEPYIMISVPPAKETPFTPDEELDSNKPTPLSYWQLTTFTIYSLLIDLT